MPRATNGVQVIAGRYALKDEVGRGGMGVVWRAEDELLGRDVAIKRVGLTPGGATPDLARAAREARLAASLNHPNVVAVFDLVDQDDQQWLVMEYVESRTLTQIVAEHGPLSPDDAARLLCQAADALAAAHRAGITHRDVKPSNILVTRTGRVKLTDFGIARATADATLTQTGMMTGSPAYLAPEVASGSTAGPQSDVWALGATLFHALTGRPPYDTQDNVLGALWRIVHEDPPRPAEAGWLAPLLEHTMTKEVAERWPMDRVAEFLAHGAGTTTSAGLGATSVADPSDESHTAVLSPVTPDPSPSPTAATAVAPAAVPAGTSAGARSAAPAGSEPGGPLPPVRRRWWPWAVTAAAAVLVVVLGVLVWSWLDTEPVGTDQARGGATASAEPSDEPSEEPAEESDGADPTAEEMEAFAQDYIATASTNPDESFKQLTSEFQQASGGPEGYTGFWSTIDSAEVTSVSADPESMTVSYTVDYDLSDGSSETDDVTLQLVEQGGELLIAGER